MMQIDVANWWNTTRVWLECNVSEDDTFACKREPKAREPRQRKLLRGALIDDHNRPHDIVIRNVSTFGLSGTLREPIHLHVGQMVAIELPGNQIVEGVIRWVNGPTFGAALETAIDSDTVGACVQQGAKPLVYNQKWEVPDLNRVVQVRADPAMIRRL